MELPPSSSYNSILNKTEQRCFPLQTFISKKKQIKVKISAHLMTGGNDMKEWSEIALKRGFNQVLEKGRSQLSTEQ